MAKHQVRTVFQPEVVIEVETPEFHDLRRQGLLAPEPKPTPKPAPKPAPKPPVAAPATGDSKSETEEA